MKKIIFIAASAASVLLLASCSKEGLKLTQGYPVTVEVGVPSTDNDPETMVSHSAEGTTHSFAWEAGDSFTIMAYGTVTAGDAESAAHSLADFTTTGSGATATFTGSLPADYSTSYKNVFAIYPAFSHDASIGVHSTRASINVNKLNLATVQDGTGYKYCFFAATNAKLSTSEGVTSFSTTPSFKLANTLLSFTVNSATPVKAIKITLAGAKSSTKLTGLVNFNTGSTSIFGGGDSLTLDIVNGGNELTDVVAAVRSITPDTATTLTFDCYSDTEETSLLFTRVLTVTSTISCGKIYPLGTLQAK